MKIGSLFSGIGGLELGLEWAGVGETSWQVESDPFCRRVLAKHWPSAERFNDVKTFEGRPADIICGGFPCQDISNAGKRVGIKGERSSLWREFARIVGLVRPRFVVVENVSALLTRGMGAVLGDLAELGYDAEWHMLSACSVGAPHTRERLFVVAYPNGLHGSAGVGPWDTRQGPLQGQRDRARAWRDKVDGSLAPARSDDRETDGFARQMVTAGGNAVVPQVAEVIGRRIMELNQ